jgi:photosystem II stability/assembly factor-like uncharacterized protein
VCSAGVTFVSTAASAHTPHDDIVDVRASPSYARDQTLLAISDNRLLRSTSGGMQWTESIRGLNGKILSRFAFAPSAPNIVYLGSRDGGVFKSTDGGATWASTNSPRAMANVADLVVSPTSPDVVVAAIGPFGGVWRTTNGGRTWASIPQYLNISAMTFAPLNSNHLVVGTATGAVFVSENDGATFRQMRAPGGDVVSALAAVPSSASFVVAGTKNGNALISQDGGLTWSTSHPVSPGDPIQGVIVSPNYPRDRTVWASAWHSGAHRSTDGGATWSPDGRGLTSDVQADQIRSPQFRTLSFARDADGHQTLYLGGYDGLFVWNDSSQRWSEIQTQSEYITGLAVSPNYDQDGTVVVNTYVKGVFISRDHGASFEPQDRGLGEPISEGNKLNPVRRMHNVVFSPAYATDHTIFTATWDRFVKSTNGGATWTQVLVANVPPNEDLRQFVIAVSPNYARDGTIFLGTRQGIVYRSTKGGDAGSWSTVKVVPGVVRSIVISPTFASDRTLFLSTQNGILESNDAGSTWRSTGPSGVSLLAISPDFVSDRTLFAGTEHGLYVTRDAAKSWVPLAGGLPKAAGISAVAVSPAFGTDHTVLASVTGTGLFLSIDAGSTFSPTGTSLLASGLVIADFDNPTSEPLQFSSHYVRDHTIYAYAQQSVVRSTDGGLSWHVLPLPPASDFRPSWTGTSALSRDVTHGSHRPWPWIALVVFFAVLACALGYLLRRRVRMRTRV